MKKKYTEIVTEASVKPLTAEESAALGGCASCAPRTTDVEGAMAAAARTSAEARAAAEAVRAAGLTAAVLADDSGLAVDALDGAPGVYSSRYAGADGDDGANNAKLLAELAAVPDGERTARFVCTLVFMDEDGTETVARGTIEGAIGREARGGEGFGYDPLFLPEAFGGAHTLAEVSQAEKNAISHRGGALRTLRDALSA